MSKNDSDIDQQNQEYSASKLDVVADLHDKAGTSTPTATEPGKLPASPAGEAIDSRYIDEHIGQLPEIDAARVVRLHNEIMANEYKIDSRQVAKKLIELESALDG